MKKLFTIIFLLLAVSAFALPPAPPASLTSLGGQATLACTTNYPVLGTGQCGSGALGTGAYATIANYQPTLSLIKGTYTNGYLCTYTTTGTLLDCNTNPASFQAAGSYLTSISDSDVPNDITIATTTDINILNTTPDLIFSDTGGADSQISGNAVDANDGTLSLKVEQDTNMTVYVELDGANEDVEIKKLLVAEAGITSTNVTITKSSGVAGLSAVYEANSTDTSYIGWMGAASISESFSYQFSNTQPTAGQAMVFAAPTGTGDPSGNKVSAQTWITPAQLGSIIDGSAHVHLTAAQMQTSNCNVTNYGQTTADITLELPTAENGLSCLFTVATAQSNHWGVQAGTNDKIYLISADGSVAAGDDNHMVVMTAAQLGQAFVCFSFNSGNATYDWMCKAISIGTSTFAAHDI